MQSGTPELQACAERAAELRQTAQTALIINAPVGMMQPVYWWRNVAVVLLLLKRGCLPRALMVCHTDVRRRRRPIAALKQTEAADAK